MANRWKGNIIAASATTSSGTDFTGKANGAWGLNSQLQQKQSGLWAKGQTIPKAPTSVTATIGDARSIVSFTAPADNTGSAITSYTVTSSIGGITAIGSASPITITGLTNGTAYTFTVTATNGVGTGPSSSPSNSVTPSPEPQIGDAMGGGFYAGKISTSGDGVATHYLIVSPKAVGESLNRVWGPSGVVAGTTSVINGAANTQTLEGLGAGYQAAVFCGNLNIAGYTDWYLPARNELEVMYYFLKPTTALNLLGYSPDGANANAVSPEPINTLYTEINPTQTLAIGFRTGETNAFNSSNYWTSTESSSTSVVRQNFNFGAQFNANPVKQELFVTRAIRKIPI
jgi:hypothetical protein